MDSAVRVLHAHSGNIFGGVEAILMGCVRQRGLCADLHMEFALCFEDRLSRELTRAGARVHSLEAVRVSRPWTVLRARRALRHLLRQKRFDVVVVHSAWCHALFAPAARLAGVPLVFWLHNRVEGRHWSERWAKWTKPDLMLCVSRDTAETAARLFPNVATEVVYAPLPDLPAPPKPGLRESVRQELNTPAEAAVIIQVSRMEAWKGHAIHLQALARLRHMPGWVCWQVGGPHRPAEAGYLEQIQQTARALSIADRVHFLGKRSDVPRLLAAADVFCQPNLETEGFSIVFMEALLAGLPVVTSAIGGALEILDDNCGILLPPGDSALLADRLRSLLADAGQRRRLGEAGRERVRRQCDPARQLGRLKDVFARVASSRAVETCP
jgi:glycosyltransferase involved in cell wall biosynthesis